MSIEKKAGPKDQRYDECQDHLIDYAPEHLSGSLQSRIQRLKGSTRGTGRYFRELSKKLAPLYRCGIIGCEQPKAAPPFWFAGV
jgi:hypothetical protein